jgi:hypothetical protein
MLLGGTYERELFSMFIWERSAEFAHLRRCWHLDTAATMSRTTCLSHFCGPRGGAEGADGSSGAAGPAWPPTGLEDSEGQSRAAVQRDRRD